MKSSHQFLANKIILGTVQLGLPYGINNVHGKPSTDEAYSILDYAFQSGISCLDTAEAYGDSQQIISSYLNKFPDRKFSVLTKFKGQSTPSALRLQIDQLQNNLNHNQLYCYSYHRFDDLQDTSLKDVLRGMKQKGEIAKIGVSVYDNDEFAKAIDETHIDVIQLPFNLLDNWQKRGALISKAKSHGKEIHIRSVFLQGIFFKDLDGFPEKLKPLIPYISELKNLSKQYNLNLQEMALNYALSFSGIDKVLVGVEKKEQLKQIVESSNKLLPDELLMKISEINVTDSSLIDPRKW